MCYNKTNKCSEHKFGGEDVKDILHCDLNNFYASVECRDNLALLGHPVAVCGSVETRRGIVLAKNYEARAFGIKTGDTVAEALKKCPALVTVHPRMHRYAEISKEVREIYRRYTDLVEPFGMDECWLDVTGSHLLFGSSEEIAHRIKEEVKREVGLTISVGVSFTKVLSKLGSDMKKPDAVTVLSAENYREKIFPLAVNEIIGVGPSTLRRLEKLRIHTLGDLAGTDPEVLIRALGKAGISLWRAVNGYDDSAVHEQDYRREVKSIGCSTTLPRDLCADAEVWRTLLALSEDVTRQLREQGLSAGGVTVGVKTNDLVYREFQIALDCPMRSAQSFARAGFELFRKRFDWRLPIRAVGIRAIGLLPEKSARQCSLFCDAVRLDREERLCDVADVLRARFGRDVVYPARLQDDLSLAQPKVKVFHQGDRGCA